MSWCLSFPDQRNYEGTSEDLLTANKWKDSRTDDDERLKNLLDRSRIRGDDDPLTGIKTWKASVCRQHSFSIIELLRQLHNKNLHVRHHSVRDISIVSSAYQIVGTDILLTGLSIRISGIAVDIAVIGVSLLSFLTPYMISLHISRAAIL